MPTNADGTMPFRQNNDLFWMSGVDQEESVLIIFPDNSKEKEPNLINPGDLVTFKRITKEKYQNYHE